MSRFLLVVLFGASLFGGTVPDRFILELGGQPAAAGKSGARSASIRDQHKRLRSAAAQAGAEVVDAFEQLANAVVVRTGSPAALTRLPGVLRVHPVRIYKPLLDRATLLQRVQDAWAAIGGAENAGYGIKIGIIDTGINPSHAAFADDSLPELDGFPKVNATTDLGLTSRKIIVARNYGEGSANDTKGHGTAVAMVAAGSTNTGPYGSITGIAPKAYLGNYKVFPDDMEGAPLDLILRALEDAVSDGMDIVNLSLGSQPAQRPESDFFVQALERAAEAGVLVVVAAGNDGPDLNTIASPATAPNALAIGGAQNDRVYAASVSILETGFAFIGHLGTGPVPGQVIRGTLDDVARLDPTGLACAPFPADTLSGSVALILRGTCTFEEKLNNVQAGGAVAAVVYTHDQPVTTMSVGSASLPAMMVSNADGVALKEEAANGFSVALNFRKSAVAVDSNALWSGSSRGPSASGAIKPDLLGIGHAVSTAAAGSLGVNGYSIENGTSLSSPMVAGAAALLKAARPGLSNEHYRSLLVNSSAMFTGTVQQTGAGLLDLSAALRSTAAAAPVSLSFGVGGSTVDAVQLLRVTNLSSQPDLLTLVPTAAAGLTPYLSANEIWLEAGESREIEVRLQGTQSGQSLGTIDIRGSHSDVVARVPFWYATPSEEAETITLLDVPESARRNTTATVLFRVTDSAGVPVTAQPEVTIREGEGQVQSLDWIDGEFPGVWALTVRLAPLSGLNALQVRSGSRTADFTIVGR